MNKQYMLLGAGIGIGVLAAMAVFYLLRPKMEQNGSGQVQSFVFPPMPSPISGVNPQVHQPIQAGSAAANGFAALSSPWGSANAGPALPAATPPDQAVLQGIQAKLAAMTAGGKQPDPRALDALLAELEHTQRTTVAGGAKPPSWFGANAKPATPATPVTPVAARPDQAALQGIQAKLATMTENGKQPDPRALDALLVDLERTQHSTVVGGVNIEALRDNLAKATEIGNLAKEMEQAAKQPKPDVQKIQGMMDQIKQLQAGMRADLMVAPTGAKP